MSVAILFHHGGKGQGLGVGLEHNDHVGIGGFEIGVKRLLHILDAGGERHGGPDTTLLAHSAFEVLPDVPILKLQQHRHGAEGGLNQGLIAVVVCGQFWGRPSRGLPEKVNFGGAAEGIGRQSESLGRLLRILRLLNGGVPESGGEAAREGGSVTHGGGA